MTTDCHSQAVGMSRYHFGMDAWSQRRFTVDQYLDWAFDYPGRYELYNGKLYPIAPGGVGYTGVKFSIQMALTDSIRAKKLPCHLLPSGIMIRVDAMTAYEPDAFVYRGEKLNASALEVRNPVLLVDVLSPLVRRIDTFAKVAGYFSLPSVAHYLVVDSTQSLVVHYARSSRTHLITRIIRDGTITLDAPGLEIAMDEIYGEL